MTVFLYYSFVCQRSTSMSVPRKGHEKGRDERPLVQQVSLSYDWRFFVPFSEHIRQASIREPLWGVKSWVL